MNEQEWLECDDPLQMLTYLRAPYNARKTLLLTAACLSRVWSSLPEECREWHQLFEDVAEGRADPQEIDDTWDRLDQALHFLNQPPNER